MVFDNPVAVVFPYFKERTGLIRVVRTNLSQEGKGSLSNGGDPR